MAVKCISMAVIHKFMKIYMLWRTFTVIEIKIYICKQVGLVVTEQFSLARKNNMEPEFDSESW